MMCDPNHQEKVQQDICHKMSADFCPSPGNLKVGIALHTLHMKPLNGLRHPVQGDTAGWYIWGGKSLSPRADFFTPLHVAHLNEKCPQVIRYLGLPPGYRFLVDGDIEDIWFDDDLLNVSDTKL